MMFDSYLTVFIIEWYKIDIEIILFLVSKDKWDIL